LLGCGEGTGRKGLEIGEGQVREGQEGAGRDGIRRGGRERGCGPTSTAF